MVLNYGHALDSISSDRLVKREVENNTRTKQIDGEGTNGSFDPNFFEKEFFTGKIHNLGRK
jgi:hypothetical protein